MFFHPSVCQVTLFIVTVLLHLSCVQSSQSGVLVGILRCTIHIEKIDDLVLKVELKYCIPCMVQASHNTVMTAPASSPSHPTLT